MFHKSLPLKIAGGGTSSPHTPLPGRGTSSPSLDPPPIYGRERPIRPLPPSLIVSAPPPHCLRQGGGAETPPPPSIRLARGPGSGSGPSGLEPGPLTAAYLRSEYSLGAAWCSAGAQGASLLGHFPSFSWARSRYSVGVGEASPLLRLTFALLAHGAFGTMCSSGSLRTDGGVTFGHSSVLSLSSTAFGPAVYDSELRSGPQRASPFVGVSLSCCCFWGAVLVQP